MTYPDLVKPGLMDGVRHCKHRERSKIIMVRATYRLLISIRRGSEIVGPSRGLKFLRYIVMRTQSIRLATSPVWLYYELK